MLTDKFSFLALGFENFLFAVVGEKRIGQSNDCGLRWKPKG